MIPVAIGAVAALIMAAMSGATIYGDKKKYDLAIQQMAADREGKKKILAFMQQLEKKQDAKERTNFLVATALQDKQAAQLLGMRREEYAQQLRIMSETLRARQSEGRATEAYGNAAMSLPYTGDTARPAGLTEQEIQESTGARSLSGLSPQFAAQSTTDPIGQAMLLSPDGVLASMGLA